MSKKWYVVRAGRPDEDDELPVADVDAHVVDGREAVPVLLDDVLQLDLGHALAPNRFEGARAVSP